MRGVRSIVASLIMILAVAHSSAVLALTNNSSLNVSATVPSSGSLPDDPPPPPPADNPPSISNVVANAATSSVQISWNVSDDNVVSTVYFEYGTTQSYGTAVAVVGSYLTSVIGLTPNTVYYYRIIATDNKPQNSSYTGSVTTNSDADVTPPSISNIQAAAGVTSCTVTWNTSELATGEVTYGITAQYGSSQNSNEGSSLTHTANLTNLLSSTTYHYKVVATDTSNNSAASTDKTCTTLPDTTPPANPANLQLTTTTAAIVLTWTNPGDADFSGIKIVRKLTSAPTSVNDGTLIYSGSDQTLSDNSIASGITYYYTLFAFDTATNYSSGVSANGRIITQVVNEICGNGVDDNNNGATDCLDSACTTQPSCQTPEVCNNSIDDNNNGDVDCADSQCSGASYCASQLEVCDNLIDDNRNGAIDCADVACFAFTTCATTPTTTVFLPPTTTVPGFTKLSLDKFSFLGGNRTFRMWPINSSVFGLAGSSISISINKAELPSPAVSFKAKINGSGDYTFALIGETYFVDAVIPAVGSHSSFFEVDYGSGQIDTIPFILRSEGFGVITGDGKPVDGATVILYGENGQPANISSPNRLVTNQNGTFGWFVPNGKYGVRVSRNGFYDRVSPLVTINTNVVNVNLDLVARPPDLLEDISASSTLAENAGIIVKNMAEKTRAAAKQSIEKIQDTVKAIEEIKNNPEAQKTASRIVAPATVSVVAVSTLSFISWSNLLPLLRLLFLQPLMLLGHGRRKGWGQVYNALSKLPIDLATVRLLQDGRILQSKVTDKEGRYAFVVNPGKYTIQVFKNGFGFPSSLLAKAQKDGRHTELYHGEVIEVTEKDALITANIPLDPVGEVKRPVRISLQRLGRVTQIAFSWLGLLVTIASLYISPRWYVWALLGVHIFLFFVFRRLAVPPKIKSWGIVYDATSKEPIGRTVARLFNSEFNKLVATQITDGSGRYYFLAGDDKYYVTYDHPQYASEKTQVLDLTGKDAETITVDIGLNKGKNVQMTPTPTPAHVRVSEPTPVVVPPAPVAPPAPPTAAMPPSAPVTPPPVTAPAPSPLDLLNSPPEPEPAQKTEPTKVEPVAAPQSAPAKPAPVEVHFFKDPPPTPPQPPTPPPAA